MDVARIISNKIRLIVESDEKLGTKSNCPLAFPRLIMVLCQKNHMIIPNKIHETISGVVNDRYILRCCKEISPISSDDEQENNVSPSGTQVGFKDWV